MKREGSGVLDESESDESESEEGEEENEEEQKCSDINIDNQDAGNSHSAAEAAEAAAKAVEAATAPSNTATVNPASTLDNKIKLLESKASNIQKVTIATDVFIKLSKELSAVKLNEDFLKKQLKASQEKVIALQKSEIESSRKINEFKN